MGISAEMILYIDEFPKSEDAAVRYALGCIRYDGRRDGIAHSMAVFELANRDNPEAVHARTGRPVEMSLPKLHRTDAERREAEAVAGGRLVAQPRGV